MDEYRKAYAIFGRPMNGVTPRIFIKVLHKLGIPATEEDCNKLFDTRYEPHGSRIIMFQDLMNIMKYRSWKNEQSIPWFENLSATNNKRILNKSHRSKPPVEPTFFRNTFQIGTPEIKNSMSPSSKKRNVVAGVEQKWSGKLKMNRSSLSRSNPTHAIAV